MLALEDRRLTVEGDVGEIAGQRRRDVVEEALVLLQIVVSPLLEDVGVPRIALECPAAKGFRLNQEMRVPGCQPIVDVGHPRVFGDYEPQTSDRRVLHVEARQASVGELEQIELDGCEIDLVDRALDDAVGLRR